MSRMTDADSEDKHKNQHLKPVTRLARGHAVACEQRAGQAQ